MFVLDDTLVIAAAVVAHPEFEYRIVNRCSAANGQDAKKKQPSPITEVELNKYGQEGWQLCGILACYNNKMFSGYKLSDGLLFFRRLKSVKQTPSG